MTTKAKYDPVARRERYLRTRQLKGGRKPESSSFKPLPKPRSKVILPKNGLTNMGLESLSADKMYKSPASTKDMAFLAEAAKKSVMSGFDAFTKKKYTPEELKQAYSMQVMLDEAIKRRKADGK